MARFVGKPVSKQWGRNLVLPSWRAFGSMHQDFKSHALWPSPFPSGNSSYRYIHKYRKCSVQEHPLLQHCKIQKLGNNINPSLIYGELTSLLPAVCFSVSFHLMSLLCRPLILPFRPLTHGRTLWRTPSGSKRGLFLPPVGSLSWHPHPLLGAPLSFVKPCIFPWELYVN